MTDRDSIYLNLFNLKLTMKRQTYKIFPLII